MLIELRRGCIFLLLSLTCIEKTLIKLIQHGILSHSIGSLVGIIGLVGLGLISGALHADAPHTSKLLLQRLLLRSLIAVGLNLLLVLLRLGALPEVELILLLLLLLQLLIHLRVTLEGLLSSVLWLSVCVSLQVWLGCLLHGILLELVGGLHTIALIAIVELLLLAI